MKHPWILGLMLALTACSSVDASNPPGSSPWALGDTLHITGTLMGWTEGHAVPTVEGYMIGEMYVGEDDEAEQIGLGVVQPDASFSFRGRCMRGQPEHGPDSDCLNPLPVTDALCENLTVSDPQAAMAILGSVYVPGLDTREPPPPRPSGWLYISTEKPQHLNHGWFGRSFLYVYADRDVRISGSCLATGPVDLELHKGWNTTVRLPDMAGFKTAPIPAEAKWWFVNVYTVAP